MVLNNPISFLILIMLALIVVIILILFNVTAALNTSIENGKKLDEAYTTMQHDIEQDDKISQNMTAYTLNLLNKIDDDHEVVRHQHDDIKQNATAEIAIGLLQHYNQSQAHEKQFMIFNELVENGSIVNKTNTEILLNISQQLGEIEARIP